MNTSFAREFARALSLEAFAELASSKATSILIRDIIVRHHSFLSEWDQSRLSLHKKGDFILNFQAERVNADSGLNTLDTPLPFN
jgi:hypothetical protein